MFAFFKDELEARKSLKAFFYSQNYNSSKVKTMPSEIGFPTSPKRRISEPKTQ